MTPASSVILPPWYAAQVPEDVKSEPVCSHERGSRRLQKWRLYAKGSENPPEGRVVCRAGRTAIQLVSECHPETLLHTTDYNPNAPSISCISNPRGDLRNSSGKTALETSMGFL